MVLFALSCVGLLLFLWLSFGGTIPFTPQGYEFRVSFPNASQLADQADVRIAGVSVGKVIGKTLDPQGNRTMATIQMNNKFAPIHTDAQRDPAHEDDPRRDLRAAHPGHAAQPDAARRRRCCRAATSPTRSSSTRSSTRSIPRRAPPSSSGSSSSRMAVQGNDQNLNSVLGNLPTFAADATDLLQVLDVQHTAVVNLVRNGGTVFGALDQSQTALRNLITSGETTFRTTAANNNAIADTFHVFPTFLNETKADDGAPAELRPGHRSAGQGARAGGAQPQADAAPTCASCRPRCARSSSTSGR